MEVGRPRFTTKLRFNLNDTYSTGRTGTLVAGKKAFWQRMLSPPAALCHGDFRVVEEKNLRHELCARLAMSSKTMIKSYRCDQGDIRCR